METQTALKKMPRGAKVKELLLKNFAFAGLLLVNRSLLEQAAALRFSAIEANLAKVTITDNAIQAVNIALELTGNHGLSRQNPLERHYRNVLCGRVHTPQSDSAWLAAGNFVFQSQG